MKNVELAVLSQFHNGKNVALIFQAILKMSRVVCCAHFGAAVVSELVCARPIEESARVPTPKASWINFLKS